MPDNTPPEIKKASDQKRLMVASANLRLASQMLPAPHRQQCLDLFGKFSDGSEMETALHGIFKTGMEHGVRGGFWRRLERAALDLELQKVAEKCRVQFNLALDRQ